MFTQKKRRKRMFLKIENPSHGINKYFFYRDEF